MLLQMGFRNDGDVNFVSQQIGGEVFDCMRFSDGSRVENVEWATGRSCVSAGRRPEHVADVHETFARLLSRCCLATDKQILDRCGVDTEVSSSIDTR